jgi:hypothetical protein
VCRQPQLSASSPTSLLCCVQGTARSSHTIEAHMRLKVDPRRGDQMVRGAAVLPHSWQTGLRIAVFAEGAAADEARAAGGSMPNPTALLGRLPRLPARTAFCYTLLPCVAHAAHAVSCHCSQL